MVEISNGKLTGRQKCSSLHQEVYLCNYYNVCESAVGATELFPFEFAHGGWDVR